MLKLTVRRGIKYAVANAPCLLIDQKLCRVQWTKVMKFSDLKHEPLWMEHNSECHDYEGLLHKLKQCYALFDENEIVTLVYYE